MNQQKLVLVCSDLSAGGAERVLSIMANYWANHEKSVTIITYGKINEESFYDLDNRIKIIYLDIKRDSRNVFSGILNNIERILTIRKRLRSINPHCIISYIDITNIITLLANFGLEAPVIVTEHTSPQNHRIAPPWALLRKPAYLSAARIVTLTERAADYFSGRLRKKTLIFKNPIPPVPKQSNPPLLDESKLWITGMGRLVNSKGFDILLDAFALLAPHHASWNLAIIGDGPLLCELQERANQLNIGERIRFLGIQKDPWTFIKQSKIFVLSSRYEGYPMALCEAMSLGTAVVSTDCQTGPREIITHRHNGLLCHPENAPAIAQSISELIEDETLRNHVAQNARKILDSHSVEAIMSDWDALLNEVSRSPTNA